MKNIRKDARLNTRTDGVSTTSGLYKNKYRIESARLKGWDYSSNGYYFITVCTKNRDCLFGNIVNGEMILSDIGKIVKTEWIKSFEIRAELFCDEYCIIPNHIHGIIIIDHPIKWNEDDNCSTVTRPCVLTEDSISKEIGRLS